MDERLIITGEQMSQLEEAAELLEQMAEDAQGLDQEAGSRVIRQAVEALGAVTGRFDPEDRTANLIPVGEVQYFPLYRMRAR